MRVFPALKEALQVILELNEKDNLLCCVLSSLKPALQKLSLKCSSPFAGITGGVAVPALDEAQGSHLNPKKRDHLLPQPHGILLILTGAESWRAVVRNTA